MTSYRKQNIKPFNYPIVHNGLVCWRKSEHWKPIDVPILQLGLSENRGYRDTHIHSNFHGEHGDLIHWNMRYTINRPHCGIFGGAMPMPNVTNDRLRIEWVDRVQFHLSGGTPAMKNSRHVAALGTSGGTFQKNKLLKNLKFDFELVICW